MPGRDGVAWHRTGRLLAALALVLQLLLPAMTALAMPADASGLDSIATLCTAHAPNRGDPAPVPPVHKLCPLCIACGVMHAFVPAEPPGLPLPSASFRLSVRSLDQGAPASPVLVRPRARAPPGLPAAIRSA